MSNGEHLFNSKWHDQCWNGLAKDKRLKRIQHQYLIKEQLIILGYISHPQKQLSSVIVEGAIRSDHHDEFNWHTTWQTSASWGVRR